MKKIKLLAVIILICSITKHLQAQSNDYSDYDTIVNQLKGSGDMNEDSDPFDVVKIHVGLGLVNSYMAFRSNTASGIESDLYRGVEVSLGIDLFSREWLAEGAIRSYQTPSSRAYTVRAQEFYLHIVHTDQITGMWKYRLGGGMLARYINVDHARGSDYYKTPATHLLAGLVGQFNEWLGAGFDVAYMAPILEDSVDRPGVDFALKVEAQF